LSCVEKNFRTLQRYFVLENLPWSKFKNFLSDLTG